MSDRHSAPKYGEILVEILVSILDAILQCWGSTESAENGRFSQDVIALVIAAISGTILIIDVILRQGE